MTRCMWTAAAALAMLASCNRVTDRAPAVEQKLPAETSVAFDLEPLPSGDGSQQWIGSYTSSGKVARFKIDFGPAESTPGKAAGNPAVKSGEGTLLPEPGSDSSVLLAELQKALRAKAAPTPPHSKTSIPFTCLYAGENLSQSSGAAFNANPPGNWTALKLTFGDGDRECEVWLYLNASTRKGQFSMKDSRYGDLLLAEFAKAL